MHNLDLKIAIAVEIIFIVGFFVWLISTGCATTPIDNSSGGVITKTISSTDWLLTIFILGSAGCVFAGLNGLKMGWLGLGACLFGLVLKMALSVTWGYYVACLLLLCGIGIAVYSVVWKNKVVSGLITGTQHVKDLYLQDKKDDVNTILMEAQNKTQQYVATVKDKLFPKENK